EEGGVEAERADSPARVEANGVSVLVVRRVARVCAGGGRARGATHRAVAAEDVRPRDRDSNARHWRDRQRGGRARIDEVPPGVVAREAVSVKPGVERLQV